ncbi:putative homeodomain transcription factor isoform X2 [Copidosoma floridanum]|uniref:putative homeodomain transcription factor isoform X2 n=1 Tax=Copidosoma floridanum TaxID=29053 RepID=UPI0006C97305|nr:putative homeodomain transcription factor isoform X2 [Copidosoma floridanum]
MTLNSLICWYQKKIGTYDKQLWEETVEQKIFSRLTHVPMKSAKFKTELIDVDFVRGSTYPKVPNHGLVTVAYLAILRLLILPLTARWWIQQTSFRIYIFFLLLYGFQMLNIYIYFSHYNTENETENVTMSEVLIPTAMMLILCMVHSQIVSTNSGPIMSHKYDKQRTRRSRHSRSSLSKPRTRKNMRENKETKTIKDKVAVRFANKLVNETCTVISSSSEMQEVVLNDGRVYSEIKSNLSANSQQLIVEKESDSLGENRENENNTPQDDDGFESLNGNGSSDNDREISKVEMEDNQVENMTKEKKDSRTSGQANFRCRISAPEVCKKKQDFSDKDLDDYDSPSSEHLSMQSSRDGRKYCDSEEEGDCEEITNHLMDAATSDAEWMEVATNRDECSYSSEFEESDCQSDTGLNYEEYLEYPFVCEFDVPPSVLLSPCASHERVSCTIWTHKDVKKAELSVLDISYAIISKVESLSSNFYSGLVLAILLSLVPSFRRVSNHFGVDSVNNTTVGSVMLGELTLLNHQTLPNVICEIIDIAFGSTWTDRLLICCSAVERFVLSSLLFFLLAVAERTYKQRLLYAKLFSHLTSSRRARKSDLPHFRLNKVRNIKIWLSVRSYLKRRGPQRSVDIIVSSDLDSWSYNFEAIFWSFTFGVYILRFMTLGTKIHKKYRNLSVLITEQINLYLQIEQKPHKKEELMVANNVLKLAADLIKELESPFKISGLSANHRYVLTITKVVLLSALSGVFSELLGFKIKIKIK